MVVISPSTQRMKFETHNFGSLLNDCSHLIEIAERIKDTPEHRDAELAKIRNPGRGLLDLPEDKISYTQELLIRVVLNAHDSWKSNKIYGKQESIEELFKLFLTPSGQTSILSSNQDGQLRVSGSSLFILDPNHYPKDQIDWNEVHKITKKRHINKSKIIRGTRVFHFDDPRDDKSIDPIVGLLKQSFSAAAAVLGKKPGELLAVTKLNSKNIQILNYLRNHNLVEDLNLPESTEGYKSYFLFPPEKLSHLRVSAEDTPDWMEPLKLTFAPGNTYLIIGEKEEIRHVAASFSASSPDIKVGVNFTDSGSLSKRALAPNENHYPDLSKIEHQFSHVSFVGEKKDLDSRLDQIAELLKPGAHLTLVLGNQEVLELKEFRKRNIRLLSTRNYSDKTVYFFGKVRQGEAVAVVNTKGTETKFLHALRFNRVDSQPAVEVAMPVNPKITLDILVVYRDLNTGVVYIGFNSGVTRVLPGLVKKLNLDHMVSDFTTNQIAAIQKVPQGFKIAAVIKSLAKDPRKVLGSILEDKSQIRSPIQVHNTFTQFPSIGNSGEVVFCSIAEIDKLEHGDHVKFVPLAELLRLSQHLPSGISDARTELMTYIFTVKERLNPGEWDGVPVNLKEIKIRFKPENINELAAPNRRHVFDLNPVEPEFLTVSNVISTEYDSGDNPIIQRRIDYVHTSPESEYSDNTITVLPVCKTEHGILVGLEDKDFPGLQHAGFGSGTFVVPTFRLKNKKLEFNKIIPEISKRMRSEVLNRTGEIRQIIPSGEFYYPSAGLTPECVYPYVVEVTPNPKDRLKWFRLRDLVNNQGRNILSGQSLISIYRFAHSVGELGIN